MQGKLIITATVFYGKDDNEESEMFMLGQIDEIPETRFNINLMLKKLGFPLQSSGVDLLLVCLYNVRVLIQCLGVDAMFGC